MEIVERLEKVKLIMFAESPGVEPDYLSCYSDPSAIPEEIRKE